MYILKVSKQLSAAIAIVLFVLLSGNVQAQKAYGNEWITYSQSYYKIKVTSTGLHRLSYSYLDSLGITGVNPQHLQLFRRGKEVAIHVAGESDGKLDPQDYVEFYGQRNDGALDRELYKNPDHQLHQLYSIYTDTAAYFLTVSQSIAGKRMRTSTVAATNQVPELYHLQKAIYVNTDRYNRGKKYGEALMPWMDEGEGYLSNYSISARSYTISGIANVEATGPKPFVEFVTVGAYPEAHTFDVNVLPVGAPARRLATYQYGFYGSAKDVQPLEFSELTAQGKVTLQIVPKESPTRGNAISFAYGKLTYPQKSIVTGNHMLFYTDSTRTAQPYFTFSNAPATAIAYDVTDPQNIVRIPGHVATGNKMGYLIAVPDSQTRTILLADAAKPIRPKPGKKTAFTSIDPAAYNYIILSNKKLIGKPAGATLPAPRAYAAYRASAAGGGYDTLLVFIDDLVDQFHYGEFSSYAISNFLKLMASSPREKHLFILGKGIAYDKVKFGNTALRELDLVPTAGSPASDILFSTDFKNNSYLPAIPTGRLAATTPEHIISYLNKVKEYETLSPVAPWRKNILQLGGGKLTSEINQIAAYLRGYKQIAEGPLLGAEVLEKYRQNVSEVVETVNVAEEVNNGVSLITFFGHSSPGITDLDIGYASVAINKYKNKGKYPIMLMNGCNAGDAFVPNNVSFGEDWLITPDKGAVAMLAHVDVGYLNLLNTYSSNFYTVAFQDKAFYGKSIGQVQQETIKRILRSTVSDVAVAMALEVGLQGDPALVLYTPAKPDYLFSGNEFNVTGKGEETVTASTPEVTLVVGVDNLGKALPDSVYVKVKRTFPDNTILITDSIKVAPILKKGILHIPVTNGGNTLPGISSFEIYLDSPNAADEFNEDNNIGSFQHFFPASGVVALSPYKYGIVNSRQVKLIAQATQLQHNRQGYYFELDTTTAFNSAGKLTHTAADAFLPTWEPTLPGSAKDSTVYYWRVRFQEYAAGEDTIWATSSFRYIQGTGSGWSQSQVGQFAETKTEKISQLGKQQLNWSFEQRSVEIDVKTVGGNLRYTNPPYGIFLNSDMLYTSACSNPGGSATARIFIIVIDDKSLTMVENLGTGVACASSPYLYEFGNMTLSASQLKLENFLKSIPTGYHVIVATVNSVPFETFSAGLKNEFKNIGSGLIGSLKNGYPYGIVGRKGAVASSVQELSASAEDPTSPTSQAIAFKVILKAGQQTGTLTSSLIGPALQWQTLYHQIALQKDDKYKLTVLGIDAEGKEQVVVEKVNASTFNLSAIDAAAYPYLKLRAVLTDSVTRTPPQLKSWHVYYTPAPEGVVRTDLMKVDAQTLAAQAARGSINLPLVFENITSTAFPDSLIAEVSVTGAGLAQPVVSRVKVKPAGPLQTINFSYTLPTQALSGKYKVSVFVNPRVQPEQHYFNNIYEAAFEVKPKLHPLMDVAFDGVHILDGELVSASPLISIVVKDENQHAFLQDPSAMSVILIDGEGQDQEISLTNNPQEVRFFPADEKNDFRLEFKPEKLADGKYTLEVNARDASGKASGVSPYRISFEVISEASVTNFYPFPNPFSTKTNFIFTLTGSTVPDNMKIQVLTVTGKVVKEILKEELGPLRIGNNKTAYAWDGTDTYGDKLANGVYLYRVVMSQTAEEMKHRYTAGDKAFKNGYGKLYILR